MGKFGRFPQKYYWRFLNLANLPENIQSWPFSPQQDHSLWSILPYITIGGIISVENLNSPAPTLHFHKSSELASRVHSLALFFSSKERYTHVQVVHFVDTSKVPWFYYINVTR